jgi:hypothetical protein
MRDGSGLRCPPPSTEGDPGRDRLAAQRDAECFYGVIPDHVWAGLRHGDELGRDIAATAGLIRWRRQALRRAVAGLRRLRTGVPPLPESCDRATLTQRLVGGFADAHRLYREAQHEYRALLDERWRRRLNAFRDAAE